MKKLTITLLCIGLLSQVNAQTIPNNSFENWTSIGTNTSPDIWGTMNNTTALSGIYTATKGTPGTSGSYYLKLTSKTIGGVVVNGVAVSGQLDSITQNPISGFAFNTRPAALTGKWQHMIYGNSQGGISIKLTRWNAATNTQITVATGNVELIGMAMSWASFSIPLTYTDGLNPDSCIITMKASGNEPTNSDYLWVDNLAFTGAVPTTGLGVFNLASDAVKVFPNPTNQFIHVNIDENIRPSEILITDITGKVVMNMNTNLHQNKLNVAALNKGLYIITIKSDEGTCSKKITIN